MKHSSNNLKALLKVLVATLMFMSSFTTGAMHAQTPAHMRFMGVSMGKTPTRFRCALNCRQGFICIPWECTEGHDVLSGEFCGDYVTVHVFFGAVHSYIYKVTVVFPQHDDMKTVEDDYIRIKKQLSSKYRMRWANEELDSTTGWTSFFICTEGYVSLRITDGRLRLDFHDPLNSEYIRRDKDIAVANDIF